MCVLYTRFSEKWSPRGPPKFRLGAPGQTCPPQDHTAPSARRFDETVPPPWSPTKLLEVSPGKVAIFTRNGGFGFRDSLRKRM